MSWSFGQCQHNEFVCSNVAFLTEEYEQNYECYYEL